MQMPPISRARALTYLAVALLLLALGGHLLLGREGGADVARSPSVSGTSLTAVEAEPAAPRHVVVHVVGAVRRPGLYEVDEGSRIDDAIGRAGGPKPKAALELVNLAAPVADGQQIVVPARSAAGVAAGAVPGGAAGAIAAAAPVHLNTATLEELDALPGVGPVTAQKILDYRTEHGAFQSIDELDAVSGIGPARLEELRELVQL